MFKLYMNKQGYNHVLAERLKDRRQRALMYTRICTSVPPRENLRRVKYETNESVEKHSQQMHKHHFILVILMIFAPRQRPKTFGSEVWRRSDASGIHARSPDLQGSGRPDTNPINVSLASSSWHSGSSRRGRKRWLIRPSAVCRPPPASVTPAVGELLMTAWLTATTAAGWQTSDADGRPWD